MFQGIEETIRSRAFALFKSRGVSQVELSEALGTSASWVSAFFGGKRPANDVHLLVKLARYFGVTVGYLLNETERGRDAGATTLVTTWTALDERAQRVVLNTALMLKEGQPDGQSSAPSRGSADGLLAASGTTKARAKRR